MKPQSVFITGGTGFVGQKLVRALRAKGLAVTVVTRRLQEAQSIFRDDTSVRLVEGNVNEPGAWQQAIEGTSAVVNLAGESIAAHRWNDDVKKRLRSSRIDATRHVVQAIDQTSADRRPSVLVNASGIDIYPFANPENDEAWVTESARPGQSFLAKLCVDWENQAQPASELGVRVVFARIGMVLGDGGALAKMTTPFRFFAGGKLGSGRQWVTWIHIDDVVGGLIFAIENPNIVGGLNLVGPNPVRNSEFSDALGHRLGRPSWLPVPGLAIKAAAGELAEYILHGRRAMPEQLTQNGYSFAFNDLHKALAAVSV